MIREFPNFCNFWALLIFCGEFLKKLESNQHENFRSSYPLFFLGTELLWVRENFSKHYRTSSIFGICEFLTTYSNLWSPQPTWWWRRIMPMIQHLEKHMRNISWNFEADWGWIFWEILRRKLIVGRNDENRMFLIWACISQNRSFLVMKRNVVNSNACSRK